MDGDLVIGQQWITSEYTQKQSVLEKELFREILLDDWKDHVAFLVTKTFFNLPYFLYKDIFKAHDWTRLCVWNKSVCYHME